MRPGLAVAVVRLAGPTLAALVAVLALVGLVALAATGTPGARAGAGWTGAPVLVPPGAVFASPRFQDNALWDDGQAEFSVYRGHFAKYGIPRAFEARFIVVKEDMNRALRVKSDPGPVSGKTATVLKVNYIQDIPTGVYTYHQMTSAFVDRATLATVKLAMSSTEGCGITFVEVLPGRDGLRQVSHSYWDGQADRDLRIAAPRGALLWDALPLWLRALDLGKRQTFRAPMLPSQLSGKVEASTLVPATIEVAGTAGPVQPAAGGSRQAYPVRVSYKDPAGKERTDTFWFDAAPPHVLVRLERGDGLTLALARTLRMAYWEKTRPGDEALLVP